MGGVCLDSGGVGGIEEKVELRSGLFLFSLADSNRSSFNFSISVLVFLFGDFFGLFTTNFVGFDSSISVFLGSLSISISDI